MRTLLSLIVFAVALQAQDASLSGFIKDVSDSVIPNATVTVTNAETGVRRKTESNESGLYSLSALRSGRYLLLVQKQGFQTASREDIILNVAQNASIDFVLQLGDVAQTITVGADIPLMNTTDASVGTLVDHEFVENIPLNGRSFQSLISLSPGTVVTQSTAQADQGQFSVAGQRAGSNYFTIDGVSANFAAAPSGYGGQTNNGGIVAGSAMGGTNSLVSVDALQEFRLETSTYAPELGRESGAQVLLITRSGTNHLHGTAFDYLRNDILDANDWFASSNAQPKPKERQNDFGAVLGGPIVKDKTFFFFSYEGLRLSQPKIAIGDVPSLQARRDAAPNVKALINAFPLPNGPATGVYLNQFTASFSDPSSLDATSIRIDHSLNSKITVFGRYNHSPSDISLRLCGGGGSSTTASLICHKAVSIDTATAGSTMVFSPRITNELRFNYSRNRSATTYTLDNFGGAVKPPDSALFSSFITPTTGFTGVILATGRHLGYWDNGIGTDRQNRQINFTDSLTVVESTHSLKFGLDIRRLTPAGSVFPLYTQYIWVDGGNPMPAFVSGAAPDLIDIGGEVSEPHLLFHNFSAYAQDTWKAAQRLTLTYGVRWDYNPPPDETSGNSYAISQITNLASATLLPKGSPFWHGDWKNFAPRLGVSYLLGDASGRPTVLRVGVGQFYDLGTSTAGFLDGGFGWFPYSNAVFPCRFGVGPNCNSPVPYPGPKPSFAFTQPYPQMRVFDPHLRLPYSLQWSVAMEKAISSSQSIKVTYLGSVGRRLLKDAIINNPNPTFVGLSLTTNQGYSNYNALQLQFQRRLSHGLQALISYSYSHSLDTNSADVATGGVTGGIPTDLVNARQDYGNSDFDIRHTLSGAATYNIPVAGVHNAAVRSLLRNWSIDGISSARTGTPFNALYSPAAPGSFTNFYFGSFNLRPDQVAGQPVWIEDSNVPGGKKLNPNAFTVPFVIRQGSEGRNSIRGFPLVEIDLALRREFSIREHVRLQFRVEGFNVLNHPNFGLPLNNIGTCTQGAACRPVYGWGTSQGMLNNSMSGDGIYGSQFAPLYQVGGPRSLQMSVKVQF